MKMTLLIALSLTFGASAPVTAVTVWSDEFTSGRPDPGIWSYCARPWLDQAQQCSALQAGHGEQLYWNPHIFGPEEGFNTIQTISGGQIAIVASRLTRNERLAVASALTKQRVTGLPAQVMIAASWKSAWLESTRQVLPGQTLTAAMLPTPNASYWAGVWGFDHVRGHPYFEVDLAEVTFNPDGTMNVRQNVHAGAQTNVIACGTNGVKRQWLVPSATISPSGDTITFRLNGKVSCVRMLPFRSTGYNVILSQQVGGLAHASDNSTASMSTQFDYVRITQSN